MQLRVDAHIEAALVQLLRLFTLLTAQVEIVFHRLDKGHFEFIDILPFKADDIRNACNLAKKTLVFLAIFDSGIVAIMFHHVFHSDSPNLPKKIQCIFDLICFEFISRMRPMQSQTFESRLVNKCNS